VKSLQEPKAQNDKWLITVYKHLCTSERGLVEEGPVRECTDSATTNRT